MHELELKLQIPHEQRAALEAALEVAHWDRTELEAHYFDTAGGQLAAHGFSWRLRRENGQWVQTLKGAGAHLLQRLEDEVRVEPEAGRALPRPDLARHRDSPAGRALAKALGGSLGDVSTLVVEQFHTRIERRVRMLSHGTSRVEVAFDRGSVHAKGQRAEVCELELELKDGPSGGVFALARPWYPPGAVVRDAAFQAVLLDLLAFSLVEDEAEAGQPGCKADGACRKGLRERLARLHKQVVRDGERFTELPVEHQHRVRKRLKRLRYLSEFLAPLYGAHAVERYVEALRPAQDALGEHNDDAVGLEGFTRAKDAQPEAWFAVGWLGAQQQESARQCRRALRKVAQAPRFWKKKGQR